jgi:hypothetical protein
MTKSVPTHDTTYSLSWALDQLTKQETIINQQIRWFKNYIQFPSYKQDFMSYCELVQD